MKEKIQPVVRYVTTTAANGKVYLTLLLAIERAHYGLKYVGIPETKIGGYWGNRIPKPRIFESREDAIEAERAIIEKEIARLKKKLSELEQKEPEVIDVTDEDREALKRAEGE